MVSNQTEALNALTRTNLSKDEKIKIATQLKEMETNWARDQREEDYVRRQKNKQSISTTSIAIYECRECEQLVYEGDPMFEEEVCVECFESGEGKIK